MQDEELISMLWERSEDGLKLVHDKYKAYLYRIADNILASHEDVQECIDDALVRLWNAIPPARPESLMTILARITRNEAFHILEKRKALKRGAGEASLAIDDLLDYLDVGSHDDYVDTLALKEAMNRFLGSLPEKNRIVFLRRYWYCDSVREAADRIGITESSAKVILHRTKKKLKSFLSAEGFSL